MREIMLELGYIEQTVNGLTMYVRPDCINDPPPQVEQSEDGLTTTITL